MSLQVGSAVELGEAAEVGDGVAGLVAAGVKAAVATGVGAVVAAGVRVDPAVAVGVGVSASAVGVGVGVSGSAVGVGGRGSGDPPLSLAWLKGGDGLEVPAGDEGAGDNNTGVPTGEGDGELDAAGVPEAKMSEIQSNSGYASQVCNLSAQSDYTMKSHWSH